MLRQVFCFRRDVSFVLERKKWLSTVYLFQVTCPGLGISWQKMLLQVEQDKTTDEQGGCCMNSACCDNLCFEGFQSSWVVPEMMLLQPGAVKAAGSFMYSSPCFRGNRALCPCCVCGTEAASTSTDVNVPVCCAGWSPGGHGPAGVLRARGSLQAHAHRPCVHTARRLRQDHGWWVSDPAHRAVATNFLLLLWVVNWKGESILQGELGTLLSCSEWRQDCTLAFFFFHVSPFNFWQTHGITS